MNTTNFGDHNSGFQAGTIHGPVNAEFHHYYPAPEQPETPPNPSILIPFSRDRDFVQRGKLFNQIGQICSYGGSWIALVGLGGVGKSQLAIEYAYQIREQSSDTWVFWLHASNRTRFEEGFRGIAAFVKVPGRQNPKANILELVHFWLRDEQKGPWVIILDNLDDASFLKLPRPDIGAAETMTRSTDPKQLISYIPKCQHGSVLITSRSRGVAQELIEDYNIIMIEPMSESDALRLFQKKLRQSDDEACTIELAAALEYMPLAIVQAAAYIVQRRPRYSLRQYLDEFRNSDRRKASLLSLKGGELRRDSEAKNSILITWQISFNYIRENTPSAADLLSLMSFCDRQGIPEFLLRGRIDDASGSGEESQPEVTSHFGADDTDGIDGGNDSGSYLTEQQSNYSDNDNFENDIVTLRNFFFIVVNKEGTTFEMHRLVQLAMLGWLKAQAVYDQCRHKFLVKLCAEMPEGQYKNWAKCQVLFPHAQSVSAERPDARKSIKEWATILYRAAWYAVDRGKLMEAENLSVKAMKARTKIYDKGHEDVAWSKALVASAYRLRGHLSEAESLQAQVIEIFKTALGEDNPSTLASMGNLASIYSGQGRWGEAERLQVQVMESFKMQLGKDHPNTLASMNNLAWIYWDSERPKEAKNLMRLCVKLGRDKLGASHPNYLSAAETLASWER